MMYCGSSGRGSEWPYNINEYILVILTLIEKNNIVTIADLGCGSGKLKNPIFICMII